MWSQYTRCCLVLAYEQGLSNNMAHAKCWGEASLRYLPPLSDLAYCATQCLM